MTSLPTSARRIQHSSASSPSLDEPELKVNLASGGTSTFKLPSQLEAWESLAATSGFQASIRGMAVLYHGVSLALPLPTAFRQVLHSVDVVMSDDTATAKPTCLRVAYTADDVTVTLTIYLGTMKLGRIDVRRSGKLRWRP